MLGASACAMHSKNFFIFFFYKKVIHSFDKKVLYSVLICEIIRLVRSNKYFWSVYCKLKIINLISKNIMAAKKKAKKVAKKGKKVAKKAKKGKK